MNFEAGKTAIVAGAAGFIGSHLSEALLKHGLCVVGVDNFVTGSQKNIQHLSRDSQFSFVEHDVSRPLSIPGKVEYIFDFACPASPTDFDRLKMEILLAGSLGTFNLLSLANEKHARFLFSSSSEVYGDPEKSPQEESYRGNVNTLGIRAIYDEGKRYGESMVMTFHRKYGLETRIVRIFNTYGEQMRKDDGRAIPTFINQALLNEDITIFGAGLQTRSPQYISDLIAGILALTKSDVVEPVNIGNPVEMSMIELSKLIIRLADSKSKLVFNNPLPQDDPLRRLPDISRAKRLLAWIPHVSPETGLKRTIEWFREN